MGSIKKAREAQKPKSSFRLFQLDRLPVLNRSSTSLNGQLKRELKEKWELSERKVQAKTYKAQIMRFCLMVLYLLIKFCVRNGEACTNNGQL